MTIAVESSPSASAREVRPAGPHAAALARQSRHEQYRLLALTAPALLLIGAVALAPIGWLFGQSFVGPGGATLVHYERLLHPSYQLTLTTTFQLAFLVTGICLLLGYPLAYLASQLSSRAATAILLCVLFPFWTSLLVRTYAWLVLLQRKGLVNTWLEGLGVIEEPLRLVHNFTGTAIGMTHIMLPFMVLPLYAAMKSISPDYLRAAANLGASPVKAFWQIFVPLSFPGIAAGVVVVFVLSLGFYVTPALLGGGRVMMWAMQIERSIAVYADWGAASALGVVLLGMTLGILWLVSRLVGIGALVGRH
jgi:putative spermidine/putrescine transport system permease protein/spermidine/putrescine transport system permease protein